MKRREKAELAATKARVAELEQCLRALLGTVKPWLIMYPQMSLGVAGEWARRLLEERKDGE